MWCAVGITFKGNSGNGDDRTLGQPLVQMGIFGLAFSQREPPPIIMHHDCNVIRMVEGRCATIERRIIEVPLRRSKLPDELRKIVPVFVVACAAAFGGKIKLVPPFELSLWRQRHLAGFLAADQITAHRHHGLAALRPKRRMHFVLTGRLEVRLQDESGHAHAVTHLSGGDSVGELSLLTGNRRAADVVAIRDSSVARLTKRDFEEITRDHPQAGLNIARYALDQLSSGTKRFVPRVTNIAVVPLHPGVPVAEFGRRLELALMRMGNTLYLDSQTVYQGLHRSRNNEADDFLLQSVLDQAEKTRRFVIYQSDVKATDWTQKGVRQADRVLLLAEDTSSPEITPIEEALFGQSAAAVLAEKELILLRSSRRTTPSGTAAWLAARHVDRHSNIALEGD